MTTVLIVDDSAVDRHRTVKLLSNEGFNVLDAADGKSALEIVSREAPDLVLTDMQMPEMNGLQLVEEIKSRSPSTPVILMTAHGSEELAVEALHKGAVSYVPKRNLANDLNDTIRSVLAIAQARRSQERLQQYLMQTESQFVLDNDVAMIPSLIAFLEQGLKRMKLCDENGLIRVAVALREALVNAMQHGNLECSSSLREHDDKVYHNLVEERRQQEPFCDRRVFLQARENQREAVYVIRDEGPGFDPKALSDPTDPANIEKASGRGLLLIRTFMDEVVHNKKGNEITMIKRADR
jgi:CheY-like chemotaxis protein